LLVKDNIVKDFVDCHVCCVIVQGVHVLVVWENVWPCLPRVVMSFFHCPSVLMAVFCFFSFLLSAPYAAGVSIHVTPCV
jgi:hypothetical protein